MRVALKDTDQPQRQSQWYLQDSDAAGQAILLCDSRREKDGSQLLLYGVLDQGW